MDREGRFRVSGQRTERIEFLMHHIQEESIFLIKNAMNNFQETSLWMEEF